MTDEREAIWLGRLREADERAARFERQLNEMRTERDEAIAHLTLHRSVLDAVTRALDAGVDLADIPGMLELRAHMLELRAQARESDSRLAAAQRRVAELEEHETAGAIAIGLVHEALWSEEHRGETVVDMARRVKKERDIARAYEKDWREYGARCEDTIREMASGALTFELLRYTNRRRCETHYHPIDDWSLNDWLGAVTGEVGEVAGVIKNIRRAETERVKNGHTIPEATLSKLGDEAADVVIYIDLLTARAGVDLGRAIVRKFNLVSRERLQCNILLPEPTT